MCDATFSSATSKTRQQETEEAAPKPAKWRDFPHLQLRRALLEAAMGGQGLSTEAKGIYSFCKAQFGKTTSSQGRQFLESIQGLEYCGPTKRYWNRFHIPTASTSSGLLDGQPDDGLLSLNQGTGDEEQEVTTSFLPQQRKEKRHGKKRKCHSRSPPREKSHCAEKTDSTVSPALDTASIVSATVKSMMESLIASNMLVSQQQPVTVKPDVCPASTEHDSSLNSGYVTALPHWDSQDLEKSFRHFEAFCEMNAIPETNWARYLGVALKDAGFTCYLELSLEDKADYNKAKHIIMYEAGWDFTHHEAAFHDARYYKGQDFHAYATNLAHHLIGWLGPLEDAVKQKMLISRFLRSLPYGIRSAVYRLRPTTIVEAAELTKREYTCQQARNHSWSGSISRNLSGNSCKERGGNTNRGGPSQKGLKNSNRSRWTYQCTNANQRYDTNNSTPGGSNSRNSGTRSETKSTKQAGTEAQNSNESLSDAPSESAGRQCSVCQDYSHTAPTCPQLQFIKEIKKEEQ